MKTSQKSYPNDNIIVHMDVHKYIIIGIHKYTINVLTFLK